jgi:hypothetical protein
MLIRREKGEDGRRLKKRKERENPLFAPHSSSLFSLFLLFSSFLARPVLPAHRQPACALFSSFSRLPLSSNTTFPSFKLHNQNSHNLKHLTLGTLLALPRPSGYVERRTDGYSEPRLVLLVAAAHVSRASASAARRVVEAVRPSAVVLELCGSRKSVLAEEEDEEEVASSASSSSANQRKASNPFALSGSIARSASLGGAPAMALRLLLARQSDAVLEAALESESESESDGGGEASSSSSSSSSLSSSFSRRPGVEARAAAAGAPFFLFVVLREKRQRPFLLVRARRCCRKEKKKKTKFCSVFFFFVCSRFRWSRDPWNCFSPRHPLLSLIRIRARQHQEALAAAAPGERETPLKKTLTPFSSSTLSHLSTPLPFSFFLFLLQPPAK